MQRGDFDPRLSPLLGDRIERRRDLVEEMKRQHSRGDPESLSALMVQLGMLQGCICAVAEVINEDKTSAKLEEP